MLDLKLFKDLIVFLSVGRPNIDNLPEQREVERVGGGEGDEEVDWLSYVGLGVGYGDIVNCHFTHVLYWMKVGSVWEGITVLIYRFERNIIQLI